MVVRWGLGSFKFVLRWWGATPGGTWYGCRRCSAFGLCVNIW